MAGGKESTTDFSDDFESGGRGKGGSGVIWKVLTVLFGVAAIALGTLYGLEIGKGSESPVANPPAASDEVTAPPAASDVHEPYPGYPWRDENGVVVPPDTECSDAPFEANNVKICTVRSAYINGRVDVTFWVPPEIETLSDVPFVMLLHGGLGSHWYV